MSTAPGVRQQHDDGTLQQQLQLQDRMGRMDRIKDVVALWSLKQL
jgi:hypothetical protein